MRTDAKDPMALNWSPYIELIIKEFENLQSSWAASSQGDDGAVSVACVTRALFEGAEQRGQTLSSGSRGHRACWGGAGPAPAAVTALCLPQCRWHPRRLPVCPVSPCPRRRCQHPEQGPEPRAGRCGRARPSARRAGPCPRRHRSSRPPGPPPPLKRRVRAAPALPAAASACGARAAPARGSSGRGRARAPRTLLLPDPASLRAHAAFPPCCPAALAAVPAFPRVSAALPLGPRALLSSGWSGKSQKRDASPVGGCTGC